MSRRQNHRHVANVDGERSSIGDATVQAACTSIDIACRKQMALMFPERHTARDMIPRMFPKDIIDRAVAAQGIIEPSLVHRTYQIYPKVTLTLNFEGNPVPTIEPKHFAPQSTFPEIADLIANLQVIREQFGRVKHMLRWFNKGATPAAIRNYWPAVMQLCPKASCFADMIEHAPARYATPTDIGSVLSLIRETAGTVAMMALTQGDARSTLGVALTFQAHTAMWEDIQIYYDSLQVFL